MQSVLVFLLVFSLVLHVATHDTLHEYLRWVDFIDPEEENVDLVFDRVVFIVYRGGESDYIPGRVVLAPGVLLTNNTVLTSYNPFRDLIVDRGKQNSVFVVALNKRVITDWTNITYSLVAANIDCGRQVVFMPIQSFLDMDNKHSPTHDLMVMRVTPDFKLINPDPKLYSIEKYNRKGRSEKVAGPMITSIANNKDILGREVKFASLGFKTDDDIKKYAHLHSHEADPFDNVVENCDEWIPREWGHFICIRNTEQFKGVGSGALLIHDYKLFGIGCFLLQKGTKGILVFTDVRPYYDLIYIACTYYDQRTTTTTSTTTTSTTTTSTTSTTTRPSNI